MSQALLQGGQRGHELQREALLRAPSARGLQPGRARVYVTSGAPERVPWRAPVLAVGLCGREAKLERGAEASGIELHEIARNPVAKPPRARRVAAPRGREPRCRCVGTPVAADAGARTQKEQTLD